MAGQGSAKISLNEIDLSQVKSIKENPTGIPAAVIGTSEKGPAFLPKTIANIQQFNEIFGNILDENSTKFGPLGVNQWLKNSKSCTFMRLLGIGDGSKDFNGAGFKTKQELVQNSGLLGANPYATGITQLNRNILKNTFKCYTFGAFMKDTGNSKYLSSTNMISSDSNVYGILNCIKVINTTVDDAATITLSKDLVNAITNDNIQADIVLTLKVVSNILVGNPSQDEIWLTDGDAVLTASAIYQFFNSNTDQAGSITIGNNGVYIRWGQLSVNPFAILRAEVGETANSVSLLSRYDNAIYNNTVQVVQTVLNSNATDVSLINGGFDIDNQLPIIISFDQINNSLVYKHTFPVIRGLLFTPQGVKPSFYTTSVSYSSDPGKISECVAVDDANIKDFGNELYGYEAGLVRNSDFKIALNGFANISEPNLLNCSFDPTKNNYFSKVMNTDASLIEEKGHYLHLYWDVSNNDSIISHGNELLSPDNSPYNGDDLCFIFPVDELDSWENKFETAKTPWVISQLFSKENNTSRSNITSFENNAIKLFRFHMLDDGECGNGKYRVLVSNLRIRQNEYSTFDISVEKFDSNPLKPVVVASWKNLNLDVESRNFIGRVIGDTKEYFDFNLEQGQQKLTKEGTFELRNSLIRIELSQEVLQSDIPLNALPCGFESQQNLFITESLGSDNTIIKGTEFSRIIQPPVPLVKSISKISGQSIKANSNIAWGIKFTKKEKEDIHFNEGSEIVFNDSLINWAKFIPSAARLENEAASIIMNNLFTLEKIAVYKDANGVIDWSSAQYVKSGNLADIVHPGIDGFKAPNGFLDASVDADAINSRYLKFRMMFEGGFDGLNIFDKNKLQLNDLACYREFNDEQELNIFTGPTIETYKKALDILSDKSAAEFQVLAVPGIRTRAVTDYALKSCEDRFDALCLIDIEQIDEDNLNVVSQTINVRNTINNFVNRELNTSFGAAYFPDVVLTNADGKKLVVPPTVCMLGVLSQNDAIDDPWFAPAGLKRGKLDSDFACISMNKDLLDELYEADINPIYSPAGYDKEIYSFGQKTLLNSKSALDRINVRRLLIDIRRKVKNIANTLLFEPNRESTLAKFSSLVEPIMKDVKDRQGVVRYKIQIDTTTTTQNDVENNTIRGKIYLQPTKSIEFISLDFVVSNSI